MTDIQQRLQVLADSDENSEHQAKLTTLMNIGCHYDKHKKTGTCHAHTLSYHHKYSPQFHEKIHHIFSDFKHTKTPKGHLYESPNALFIVTHRPGGTKFEYMHHTK